MSPFAIAGPAVVNVSGGRTSALMLRRVLDAHGGALADGERARVLAWARREMMG